MRHRQTKGAATDMFDLPPPRHISTLGISLVAERAGQGRLTEPAADARRWRRGLLFVPLSSRSLGNLNRSEWLRVVIHPRCRQILEVPAVASGDP